MPTDHRSVEGRTLSFLLNRPLLALSAVASAIVFAQLLSYCSYGLDISSEGFYLSSIANPFPYVINVSASLFGFVYHWPYRWVGGDIGLLRMANVTLTMGLGWVISFLLIRRVWRTGWLQATVLSAGMATLTLCHFNPNWGGSWGRTPTHYSLTFQSILVVMIGLLLADRPARIGQVVGWTLVGVGGVCCVMARPPTAGAIALVIMLYVVALHRRSLLPMLGAALVTLALLTAIAYLVDGGITALATRMFSSVEMDTLRNDGHAVSLILRIDELALDSSQVAIAALAAIALLVINLMAGTHNLHASLALATVLTVTVAITLAGIDPISIKPTTLFLASALTCLSALFYRGGSILRSQTPTSSALAIIFLLLPHLSALGSNLNYWLVGSMNALFWMLAVVAFLSPLAQQERSVIILLPLTVLAQLLTASIVNAGILKPWRQAKDLRTYTNVMPMPAGTKLVLSQSFHDYLTAAQIRAREAGLQVNAPVVYLTGLATSLQYVLETRPLGLPWLPGGSSGSNSAAVEALRLESCSDLAKAWILIEPDGPAHLDHADILASFGASPADYVAAATLAPPMLDASYPNPVTQSLLKPNRPAILAEQSCREARRRWPDGQRRNRW